MTEEEQLKWINVLSYPKEYDKNLNEIHIERRNRKEKEFQEWLDKHVEKYRDTIQEFAKR